MIVLHARLDVVTKVKLSARDITNKHGLLLCYHTVQHSLLVLPLKVTEVLLKAWLFIVFGRYSGANICEFAKTMVRMPRWPCIDRPRDLLKGSHFHSILPNPPGWKIRSRDMSMRRWNLPWSNVTCLFWSTAWHVGC